MWERDYLATRESGRVQCKSTVSSVSRDIAAVGQKCLYGFLHESIACRIDDQRSCPNHFSFSDAADVPLSYLSL